MEDAACATVQLNGRAITVALSARQLEVRSKGDLVTAEIIDVEDAPPIPRSYSASRVPTHMEE